jgi:molybdopterin-guanine dinucleotide biosynthesis adapter protein
VTPADSTAPPTPPHALPPIVSVIGLKDSGKTSTAVALVAELVRRGRRVMVVKHGHHFNFDVEGTDSWRLRNEANAERVVLAGPDEFAVMGGWPESGEADLKTLVRWFAADAEIVVAEGFKGERVPKIEVYRTDAHPGPLFGSGRVADEDYLAIVSDAQGWKGEIPLIALRAPDLGVRLADLVERSLLT